ncbi:radical SAM protein [Candidatus Falkowbacteria bacterium]|nr:radical SAM protein [Candidatus Falkowbacteria bacterium]
MPTISVNSNFHSLGGKNVLDKDDEKFKQYRRHWEEWPKSFYVGGFPLFIDIESTSACNLKCTFCYNRERIIGGFITFDLVKKIIDEGADKGLCGVKFNFRGEPLLHPQIHEFVRYAKDRGLIDVYFNSHGLLLNDDMARKLIDARLDRISISFEGYTKEIYEKHRVGSNFEIVVQNIRNLVARKKALSVDYPKIRIQTVAVPELKDVYEQYKDFWLDNGADEVAYLDFKDMKNKHLGISADWTCPQIWQRAAVMWDGTFLPCNHDEEKLIALGNVRNASIFDMWHSTRLNEIREKHKAGLAHTIPGCDGCFLRDSEIKKSIV